MIRDIDKELALEVMDFKLVSPGMYRKKHLDKGLLFDEDIPIQNWWPSQDSQYYQSNISRIIETMNKEWNCDIDISSCPYYGPDNDKKETDGWLVTFRQKKGLISGSHLGPKFCESICEAALATVRKLKNDK